MSDSPVGFQHAALTRVLEAGLIDEPPKFHPAVRAAIVIGGSTGLWMLLALGVRQCLGLAHN